jgi:hypothetical protein
MLRTFLVTLMVLLKGFLMHAANTGFRQAAVKNSNSGFLPFEKVKTTWFGWPHGVTVKMFSYHKIFNIPHARADPILWQSPVSVLFFTNHVL